MFCDKPGDALVVGLRGCGAESQSDFGQAQLEQAISPAALAVIIPLGRGPREDFDLAIIEAEAPLDGGNLRLEGAVVRPQPQRRADLDDGAGDAAAGAVSKALR